MSEQPAPAGTIIPPPDIRVVVEKTVDYIARRGEAFLERIRNSNDNAKFSFINENDPYFKYYQWRLEQHESGNVKKEDLNEDNETTVNNTTTAAKAIPKEPYKFEFSTKLPPISAQDLEVIKLTAKYVAKAGNQFLVSLNHREKSNFQYDFLKPSHSLYILFTSLVQQYKKVIDPSEDLKQRINAGVSNKYLVLSNAKQRAEWLAYREERDKRTAEEAEKERIAYAQIDWHDFTLVETIQFTQADLDTELPPPITLAQIQFASLEQKRTGMYRIEEAAPDYEPEQQQSKKLTVDGIGTIDLSSIPGFDGPPSRQPSSKPPPPTQPTPPPPPPPSHPTAAPSGMKIRPAGTTIRNKLQKQDEPTIISPYTGEAIPQSKFDQHMHIMSLDPSWKEQRAIEQGRQSTTNLSTNEVDINLKRLASSRSDLFDSDNVPQTEEERERIKRAAREVQWDGRRSSKQAAISKADTNRPVDEQDRQKHLDKQNRIGPTRKDR